MVLLPLFSIWKIISQIMIDHPTDHLLEFSGKVFMFRPTSKCLPHSKIKVYIGSNGVTKLFIT